MTAAQIDWGFIGALEGRSLVGYVPNPTGSASGVTVATGIDLGQLTLQSLAGLGLSAALSTSLVPYLGLRGASALTALAAVPLALASTDADALDAAVRGSAVAELESVYDRAATTPFAALPGAGQTVICSVAFQYGPGLATRTPKFWRDVVARDWDAVHGELQNFGDGYRTRRRREAAYLSAWLGVGLAAA